MDVQGYQEALRQLTQANAELATRCLALEGQLTESEKETEELAKRLQHVGQPPPPKTTSAKPSHPQGAGNGPPVVGVSPMRNERQEQPSDQRHEFQSARQVEPQYPPGGYAPDQGPSVARVPPASPRSSSPLLNDERACSPERRSFSPHITINNHGASDAILAVERDILLEKLQSSKAEKKDLRQKLREAKDHSKRWEEQCQAMQRSLDESAARVQHSSRQAASVSPLQWAIQEPASQPANQSSQGQTTQRTKQQQPADPPTVRHGGRLSPVPSDDLDLQLSSNTQQGLQSPSLSPLSSKAGSPRAKQRPRSPPPPDGPPARLVGMLEAARDWHSDTATLLEKRLGGLKAGMTAHPLSEGVQKALAAHVEHCLLEADDEFHRRVDRLQRDLAEARKRNSELEQRMLQEDQALKERIAEVEARKGKVAEELREELHQATLRNLSLSKEIADVREQLTENEIRNDKLSRDIKEATDKASSLQLALDEANASRQLLQQQVALLEARTTAPSERERHLEGEVQSLSRRLALAEERADHAIQAEMRAAEDAANMRARQQQAIPTYSPPSLPPASPLHLPPYRGPIPLPVQTADTSTQTSPRRQHSPSPTVTQADEWTADGDREYPWRRSDRADRLSSSPPREHPMAGRPKRVVLVKNDHLVRQLIFAHPSLSWTRHRENRGGEPANVVKVDEKDRLVYLLFFDGTKLWYPVEAVEDVDGKPLRALMHPPAPVSPPSPPRSREPLTIRGTTPAAGADAPSRSSLRGGTWVIPRAPPSPVSPFPRQKGFEDPYLPPRRPKHKISASEMASRSLSPPPTRKESVLKGQESCDTPTSRSSRR